MKKLLLILSLFLAGCIPLPAQKYIVRTAGDTVCCEKIKVLKNYGLRYKMLYPDAFNSPSKELKYVDTYYQSKSFEFIKCWVIGKRRYIAVKSGKEFKIKKVK